MAIRKSKEKSLQFSGKLDEAKKRTVSALEEGGFKKIKINESLNQINAEFNNFFVVGSIDVALSLE